MEYKKYTNEDRERVRQLFEQGYNKCQISRETNIPRATIKGWLQGKYKGHRENQPVYLKPEEIKHYLNTSEKRKAYSFILAVYLSDGYISPLKRFKTPSIRFFNDCKYPLNTQEWKDKLQIILPNNKINIHKKKNCNAYIVLAYNINLPNLFPQHAPGKKHLRKLEFQDWQLEILKEYPEEFIRGCFQSDGSIYYAKQGKYPYKRYNFSNRSKDIIDLLYQILLCVGVERKPTLKLSTGGYVIQIQNKKHVSKMETIISNKE